ncbi:MAG: hypothetical protein LBT60_07045 [Oscillospiraceae bacterium]|nr:hypothetical protein [Oscillospiraceae bacterium]
MGAVGLGLAIVGLVLSIVASLVIAYGLGALVMEEIETQTILWVGLGLEVFSLALAITGTVLGVKARKQMPPGRQGLGTAAMVFGIIGIALSAILTVACGCAVGAIAVSFNSGDWEDIVRYSIY